MNKFLLLTALLFTAIAAAQVTAGPIPDYSVCDDITNDGIETFDLSQMDIVALGTQSASTHIVSYYLTQVDADNDVNRLSTNFTNFLNPQDIFVRVQDTVSGNFATTVGTLIVETVPVINNIQTYTFCGIVTATGDVQVDLFQIEPFLTNGQNNLLFTYFLSQQDADANTNPLSTTFVGSVSNPVDIFIRAQTTLNCFEVINIVAFFLPCNQTILVSDLETCEDANGEACFDLSENTFAALGTFSPNQYNVSYHTSQADADNNTNALTSPYCTSTSQVIYIRVNENSTNIGDTTQSFHIAVIPSPPVYTLTPITGCDDDGDGFIDWNSASVLAEIDATATPDIDSAFTEYYLTQQDALDRVNPIGSGAHFTTTVMVNQVYIRTEFFPSGCASASLLQLIQDPNCFATGNLVTDLEACEDANGQVCFDLNQNTIPALGTFSPNQYNVSYHTSQADADNNTNALTSPYCASTSQVIYIRVNENSTNIGDTTQSFNVAVIPSPPVYTLTQVTGCDDDGDGFIDWNSASVLAEIDATATPGIDSAFTEYYLTQQDALDRVNPIGSGAHFTTTVMVNQVYVRTEFFPSGCASASLLQLIQDPNCFAIGNPSHLLQCADSGVQVCFDLTQHASQIMANNNPADFIISYHTSDADANAGTNAIASPSNYCVNSNQVIYFRLEENATGAYRVGAFDLIIKTLRYDNSVALSLTECDDDLNGAVDFDLTQILNQLNATGAVVFYEDPIDAENETSPLTNLTPYNFNVNSPFNTIFIRETIAGDCDVIYPIQLNAQSSCNNSYLCDNALSLCDRLGQPFVNTADGSTAEPGNYYPFSQGAGPRNPSWFYIPIENPGDLTVEIYQNSQPDFLGQDLDIDFVIYGPFNSPTGGCATGITQANYVDDSFTVNMPEIGQINNAQAGEYYLLLTSNFSNLPGFIKVEIGAGSTATVNCDGIRMQSMLDVNLNGVVDTSDVPFPLGTFDWEKNMSGNVMQVVTTDATYTIYDTDPTSSYDLGYTVLPAYAANYSVTPATYVGQTIPAGSGITIRDFLVTPINAYDDVVVYILPQEQPRPGFTYKETVVYANLGTTAVPMGQLQFTYDTQLSIVAVDDPAAIINPTTVDLAYANLLPFEYRTMEIEMLIPVIPTINLGDLLTNTATITPVVNDIMPGNNTTVSTQIVIGSYDPNDMMESRGEFINPAEFSTNDYFYYTIRFENTGTASAINVRVEDTLDAQLDWNSMEMINSSHNYIMERMEDQVIWRFDNILLPDSTSDPVGANGHIYFKIKPHLATEGTVIPSTAEIYFDFNPPIITNTFISTFQTPLSIDTPSAVTFSMYPNPTSGMVQVNLKNSVLDNAQVVLYDLRGRISLSRKLNNNNPQLDLTELPAGIYIAELRNGDTVYTSKVVKQ